MKLRDGLEIEFNISLIKHHKLNGYQILHLIVYKRKYTLNRSFNGMHGYDKYCQKRYSIIENYDAIARFVYSEYMQDSASSA